MAAAGGAALAAPAPAAALAGWGMSGGSAVALITMPSAPDEVERLAEASRSPCSGRQQVVRQAAREHHGELLCLSRMDLQAVWRPSNAPSDGAGALVSRS